MPTPIQRGSEALALARHYNLKGKLPLILDEVIVPVHIVGELGPADLERPAGADFSSAAGGAAVSSYVGVENPVGSSTLIVVTGFKWTITGGARLWIENAPFTLAPALNVGAHWRDSRLVGLPVGRTVAGNVTPPPPANGPIWAEGGGGGAEAFANRFGSPSIYLGPGSRLLVVAVPLNTAIVVSLSWAERELQASSE